MYVWEGGGVRKWTDGGFLLFESLKQKCRWSQKLVLSSYLEDDPMSGQNGSKTFSARD